MDNRRRRPPVRRRKINWEKRAERSRKNRIIGIGTFLTMCIGILIFRMWYLQHNFSDDYSVRAARQRAFTARTAAAETFAAELGGFVDRHMQPITGTQQVFTVTLDVYALHRRYRAAPLGNTVLEEVYNAVSVALGIPRWTLMDMFLTDSDGNLLMRYARRRTVLSHEVPAEIAIPLSDSFVEINREETSVRWHQDPFFAPQVIGFMRGGYVWGLESYYRRELEGEQGRNIYIQGETEMVPVRDGYTLITTLDADIQRLAQYHADRSFRMHPSRFTGMIVMNPNTGEVLAMSQAPTFSLDDPFNPEYFTCPHLAEIWEYLDYGQRTNQVMTLWRNYHTTRSSEPGSTFKPFVMAAAIEEGVITQHTPFFCEGVRTIIDQRVPCHRDWGCGSISFRRALYTSCNLAMVDINRMLGRDLFYRYRGYFGFGERTGIDLPGEECVSSPAVMYPLHMLNAVEMATSSMGQGFNATTMQMINAYAALINGGNLLRPFLVSQIVDNQGNIVHETEPAQVVRRVISPETSDFMRNEMRYVVSMRPGVGEFRSTGHRLYIEGHSIGGKTGTAQQGVRADGNNILTYVAFMPVDNPQFLVLKTIDHIEDGNAFAGDTVAPLLRDFFLDLIRIRNIQPCDGANVVTPELFGGRPTPDFGGQRLTDAVRYVVNMGTGGYQVVGGGTIISHTWPPAGHTMPETSPIIFYTDADTRISERMVTVPDVVGLSAETANFLLREVGLPPVIFTGRRQGGDDNFRPHTGAPIPVGEGETEPPPPIVYAVYQQFPAAGSEIESGTQVIVRAR
jgi:stage V sporulation protein D (sporulation-specific penicillin-binding protein)